MTNNQPNESSPLKILLWNANGLPKHKNEHQIVLNDLKIDISLITETHFTEKTKFSIYNYTLNKTNHPDGTAHAGSCILVSNSIQYNILTSFQESSIQATSILIKINSIPITVSSIYCPPRHAIQRDTFLRLFNTLGHHFIAGGDFNAKHSQWGCISNNQRGKTLHSVLNNCNLSFVSPLGPTYCPSHSNRNPDILDFFITNIPNHLNTDISNIWFISSDHTPVILSIGGSPN
jgi:exonuclease III